MIKNYLKIAVRNLFKEKGYTLINVASLAVGIGCFLFLLLLDQYAFNFDTFHKNADRIYRVNDLIVTESGSEINAAVTPWPWAEALEKEFPQVENYVRFMGRSHTVTRDNDVFNYRINYVDEAFFDIFSFDLQKGDPDQALDAPNKVVLTPWIAENLFGRDPPVGNVIQIDGESFEVTGVTEDIPYQSSIGFDLLVSSENLTPANYGNYDNWKSHSIHTYLLLEEGADKSKIEGEFKSFLSKYIDQDAASRYSPWLQAYTDMYLGPDLFSDHGATLDKSYVYIFTAIAFLILLISCINFINISTARAARRNVEVGIRKVIGAVKRQLIFQYLFEVLLITTLAVGISIVLVEWALPWFNRMTDWAVQINYFENSFFMLSAVLVVLFVTLFAGGYPAFYLTKFRPTEIFRNRGASSGKSWLRTTLVVSQFVLAIFLLVSSRVVDKQVQYLNNKDLGYQEENVMQVSYSSDIAIDKARNFRQELLRNPDIRSVSLAANGPFSGGTVTQYNVEKSDWSDGILINTFYVDDQFIPLLGIDIIAGRNFNPQLASDSLSAFIINEAAARKFGWEPSESVGKTILQPRTDQPDLRGEVIGVINDFHFESLENEINPLILRYRPENFDNLLVKSGPVDLGSINSYVKEQWNRYFPGESIYYSYVEDNLSGVYETESIIGNLLSMLTYLTIFIACLGLLGLASYTTLQRTKEISIRKVMGATVREIVSMLTYDFIRYVLIALVIGIPLAWWAVNLWLQRFAYNAGVGVWTILFTLAVTLLIALGTVSWQTIRAATANPADNLRSE